MTDYLLIECIINNLVRDRILNPPRAPWKKTMIETQFYYADFNHTDTNSVVSFRVSIINGDHVISITSFVNQAKFFGIDPAIILEECKL